MPSTVMTVTGPVSADALGVTLAHEHLFLDLRNQFTEFADPDKRRRSHRRVASDSWDWLRRNPYALRDNLLLDDPVLAAAELRPFVDLGGRTIVECTSVGICRQPAKLRRLAERTGLNLIAGCGYYTADTHPPALAERSVERIARAMVRDLTEGIAGTGVRAGVIGEIGTSNPIHSGEKKVLRAAALAHARTGVPVYVHTYPWGQTGLEAADILLADGVPPGRIVVCHVDVEPNRGYIDRLLARGVWVEFDDFGKEFEPAPDERGFAGGVFVKDSDRVALLCRLMDAGRIGQLLVTTDICLKSMLHAHGGPGYDHILRTIVPRFRAAGLGQPDIDQLLVVNPRLLLGVTPYL